MQVKLGWKERRQPPQPSRRLEMVQGLHVRGPLSLCAKDHPDSHESKETQARKALSKP